MNKKQTMFLSAVLGIGSVMMLSFLIISAMKADTGCTVAGILNIDTGGADALRIENGGDLVIYEPADYGTGFAKLYVNTGGELITPNDLKVDGDLEIGGNTAWHAGNDGSGTGLDADTVDGYEAADLMAAGGDDCPNCVLYQSIDIDGDGHTLLDGDCDETCDTCYIGSTEFTLSPDGKDQDCDGEIDEVDNYKIKQCGNSSGDSTWRPVRRSVVITACQSYCSSQGSSYNSIGCLEFQPNATNVAHTLDFADCSRGDINKDYSSDPVACGSYQACYCNVIR